MSLSGKYTKTLYRLLKQFRNTGLLKIDWSEFCKIMNIPESYKQADIDKRILNPAIKELSAEQNLFTNEKKTIFKNLTYKKIKDPKGRGRGGKVIGIEFYFTPEPKRDELKEMIEAHVRATGSEFAAKIISHFNDYLPQFKKIIAKDYQKMLSAIGKLEEKGVPHEDAKLQAFYMMQKS